MRVLWEPQGGILEPEKMVAAHCNVAAYHGATVHTGEQVGQRLGKGCPHAGRVGPA
jgi:hypothetical protein